MVVKTLNQDSLANDIEKLKSLVIADGFRYDAIVSIARAGDYIAEKFNCPNTFSLSVQRPTTVNRNNWKKQLLRSLPLFICDILRIVEAKYLIAKRNHNINYSPCGTVRLPDDLKEYLKKDSKKILIIDDAIDSGQTMRCIVNALASVSTSAQIRTAVIAQTRSAPMLTPHYKLYNPGTLLRFPWSDDYKI